MARTINLDRRRFLSTAALTMTAGQLGLIEPARAQSSTPPAAVRPTITSARTSFGALKQIDAGVLNVGYAEAGRSDGSPVLLLHGWPQAFAKAVIDVASYAQ